MVSPPPPSSNDAPKPSRWRAIGAGFVALAALTSCSLAGANAESIEGDVPAGLANPGLDKAAADDAAADDAVAAPVTTTPTTRATTTRASTTAAPTTAASTTVAPTTLAATTLAPTTAVPTTVAPTTVAPTTTVLSPAIVWVGGPASAFIAVGDNSGSDTAHIQQRLIDLGFWLNAVDGDYGLTTSQAVMAFQKYVGIDATGSVNQATADALTTANWRAHGLADAGTLVEIDKDLQLLFIVQNGRTVWIFNTSTGDGQPYTEEDQNTPGELQEGVSVTRNGLHAVYRERAEGWWEGDLGRIYRPKYFSGGQAVHGSNSVPNYPASHGCVRVTVPAMDFIWDSNLLPIDTPVWVHGAN